MFIDSTTGNLPTLASPLHWAAEGYRGQTVIFQGLYVSQNAFLPADRVQITGQSALTKQDDIRQVGIAVLDLLRPCILRVRCWMFGVH